VLGTKRLNDKQLVNAIKNGDKDAMVQLYKDNYVSVRNYILKNNGNHDDAEDVLQDAIIVVWEKIQNDSLELKAKLSTFIFAVVKNQWLKRLNKLGRQVGMDGVNTEKMTDQKEEISSMDKQLVVDMMQELGDKCKELLTLYYFDGLDMNSIAERMEYNNSDTVKAKKHQCFKQLKTQFLSKYKRQDFIDN
jgi:RNA polymerase sigma factor (sigma-70 family)